MSDKRQRVSTGSPYEPRLGISRAVRAGRIAAAQARRCFEIVREALEKLGAKLSDVTRTRILLTRIEDWEAVAAVHAEYFREVRPASIVMQVSRFVDPDWLVEIEADAVVEE